MLFLSTHKRLNFSVSFILSQTMKAKLVAFVFINGFRKAGGLSPDGAKLLTKTAFLTLAWINLQVCPRWALYMLSSRRNYMLNNLSDMFTKPQWEYLSIKTLLMVLYERGKSLRLLSKLTNHRASSSNCNDFALFQFCIIHKGDFLPLIIKLGKWEIFAPADGTNLSY